MANTITFDTKEFNDKIKNFDKTMQAELKSSR